MNYPNIKKLDLIIWERTQKPIAQKNVFGKLIKKGIGQKIPVKITNMAGRPLKFQDKEELEKKIQAYFEKCDELSKPYTITGLAVALDTCRDTLLDYQEKEEYSDTIKRAKETIHAWTEEYLFTGKNQTGAIFNLKNNYGWKDKTEQETTLVTPKPIMELNVIQPNNSDKAHNILDQED